MCASFDTFEDPPPIKARSVFLAFVLAVLLVFALKPAVAAPSGFTYCAAELGYCELSGVDAFVVFGAGEGACDLTAGTCTGTFSAPIRYAVGFSGTCSAEVLGISSDPAPGIAKACYWVSAGGVPPPDPDPGEDTFDPNNATHLLQAVLAMGHVFIFWMGYRSGDKV